MTQAMNWLGFSTDFSNVPDEVATDLKSSELLKEGWYKAMITSVEKKEVGENKTPCLEVGIKIEDFDKEIKTQVWLPNGKNDEFKNKAVKNFLSRCAFSQLKEKEYFAIPDYQKNQAMFALMPNQFTGIKVLVKVVQEPFISTDKTTKTIQFTNTPMNAVGKLPKNIEKLTSTIMNCQYLPKILFANKIAPLGFQFYNEYNPEATFKDNYAKDFVDMYKNTTVSEVGVNTNGF